MYQAGPWPYKRRVVCKVEKPENQMTYMKVKQVLTLPLSAFIQGL